MGPTLKQEVHAFYSGPPSPIGTFPTHNFGNIKKYMSLLFAAVPGSSINSWDSWFIFNLRKINTCYYTDNSYWSWRVHTWQSCVSHCRQHACIENVHTWASVFLRHLASTSFMVPFWPYRYWLRLCPHSGEPPSEATLVQRMLFIVLMTAAHISPNVFFLRVASHQGTTNISL